MVIQVLNRSFACVIQISSEGYALEARSTQAVLIRLHRCNCKRAADCLAWLAQTCRVRQKDETSTCHNSLYKEAKHAEHGQAAVLDLLDLMGQASCQRW